MVIRLIDYRIVKMELDRTILILFIFTFFMLFTAHCRRHHHGTEIAKQQQIASNTDPNKLLSSSKTLFEGDILVRQTSEGSQLSAVFQGRLWPDAKIPYQISNDYNQEERMIILNAMNAFHEKTCVRFSPRSTDERHFIDISKAKSGCSSYVGRQGGSQMISLDDGCVLPRIVKHELMHAIGFYHEQSRTDRDDYVLVHLDNVEFGLDGNFQKYDSTQVQSLRTPYDLKSIMHYGWNYFARDTSRPTITAKNGGDRIEPSNDFTETDILDINRLYDCKQEKSSELSKLEAQVTETAKKLHILETQVSGYHTTSTFIWRITNFRSKRENTAKEPYIYSEPFYTSQYGYKLKVQVNFDGFGNGKGTHIAIFMEIQPGEYDALLPWPFSRKVTFTLIDQSTDTKEKNNVEYSMLTENTDYPHCFTRPLKDKSNLAIGNPTFASHKLLVEGGKYVKDDTLFIKFTTSD